MLNLFKNKNKLHCFSPEVMLATFVVEVAMAAYVLVRYRLSIAAKLIVAMLVCLATFQVVEYKICGGTFDVSLAKIGFIAITLLPVFGLHFISRVAGVRYLVKTGYFFAGVFIFHIIFSVGAIHEAICGGNYVTFETSSYLDFPYSMYYFVLLLVGIWISAQGAFLERKSSQQKNALFWMLIGYLSFMFPMAMLYMWNRDLLAATTSVMCGFAVIYAIILTFKVLPAYKENDIKPLTFFRHNKKKK